MKAYGITDKGLVRKNNEDAIFISPDPVGLLPNLFVVCDGMGGHNAGEHASKIAIEEIINSVQDTNYIDPKDIMKEALKKANKAIIKETASNSDYKGMGTTAVMASLIGSVLYVANIGDSRLYILKNGLIQITKDHSLVEEMVREGRITRGDEVYNSKKNIITKALGMAGEISPDFFTMDVDVGNLFILCSDGLCGMLSDDEIFDTMRRAYEPQYMPSALLKAASKNGGKDNISVIVVDPELSEVDIWC